MNTGSGMGCPIDLTDDQLESVVGGRIQHEISGGDTSRNKLEDDIWALVNANGNKPSNTVVLAANSKDANILMSRLYGQMDLATSPELSPNKLAADGFTKGELASLAIAMDRNDALFNQPAAVTQHRGALEDQIQTLLNAHGGTADNAVLVAANSKEMAQLVGGSSGLANQADLVGDVARMQSDGLTKRELTDIFYKMQMGDMLLRNRGVSTRG